MKQRYTIGRYVSVAGYDENGDIIKTIAEAEMPLKVVVGTELRARPYERGAEWIDLGVVREVRNYKKRSHIEVLTNRGWYVLEVDVGLESVMTDFMNFSEI